MRRRLALLCGFVLLVIAGGTAFVRWAYFSQTEHPSLQLSRPAFPPLTKRLVILLVDSVPFEMAFEQRKLPFVASLRPRATWGIARSEEPTMTGQMVYTIVTGARPFLYNVVRNWRQNRMPHETVFDALSRRGKRLELYGDVPWSQMFGDRFHRMFTLPEEGRRPDGRPYRWHHAVNELDHRVLPHLDRALSRGGWDVLIWHIHGTDLVMHKYLRDTVLTAQKLRWADLMVKGIVTQLDDGHTTFLLLSDHGCAANGRHGYQDPVARDTFYLLLGPQVRAGQRLNIRQIDLAPTVATLFGLTPAAPSAGRPAVEALRLTPAARAARLVEAARQRARYLRAREVRQPVGVSLDLQPLRRAEATRTSDPAASARAATAFLRQAAAAELRSRRERRVAVPVAVWIGLLGVLVLLGVWLGRLADPASVSAPGALTFAGVGVGLAVLWGLGLVAATYNGRFFNDHLDLWPPLAQAGFWAALVAGGGVPLLLLRRLLFRAFDRHPWLVIWTTAVALAVLPGYFQGLYALVALLALLGLLLFRPGAGARRDWLGVAVAAAVLGVALVWEYSWRPHFYLTRGYVIGLAGAAAAVAGFGVAAWAVIRGEPPHRGAWWGVALLAALVGLRHVLVPLDSILHFPTVGDQVLAQLEVRLLAVAITGAWWWGARRLGLRGPAGATLGALALLAAWGSAFEALAFGLLIAGLAPLRRLPALRGRGPLAAAVGALALVLARIVLLQVHEFHFNFTSLHDLLLFAPDTDEVLPTLAGPVALRYALPALVLVPLIFGQLAPTTRFAAIVIALVYTGGRVLHLLVITRLTIDQLYANWRGLGELILTVLWVAGLVLAYTVWELAQGRVRREGQPEGG